jgi:hypothetical protein
MLAVDGQASSAVTRLLVLIGIRVLELSIFIVDSVHKKICQIVQINLSCKHLSGGAISLLEVQSVFGVSRRNSKDY